MDETLTYWTGVLYIGHMSLPLLYLLGLLAVSLVGSGNGQSDRSKQADAATPKLTKSQ